MKKVTYILIFAILISLFPANTFAKSIDEVFLNETFVDRLTYDTPAKVQLKKTENIVKVLETDGTKVMLIKNRSTKAVVKYPLVTDGKIIFLETKLKQMDLHSQKSLVLSDAEIMTFKGNNIEVAGGGALSVPLNDWITVRIRLNTATFKYDVQVNGKYAGRRIYLDSGKLSNFGFISYGTNGEETSMIVDYVRVYSGIDFANPAEFPVATYNQKSKTDTSLDVPLEPEIEHIYTQDMETTSPGNIPGGIIISGWPITVKEENGNKYLHMGKQDDKQVMIDINVNRELYKTVFQTDVKVEKEGGGIGLFVLRDTAGKFLTPVSINQQGRFLDRNSKELSKISCLNEWINLAVAIDFENKNYSVFINKELAAEKIDFSTLPISENIMYARFQMYNGETINDLMLDNINIYTGTKIKEDEKKPDEEIEKVEMPNSNLTYDEKPLNTDFSSFQEVIEDVSQNPSKMFTDYKEAKEMMKSAAAFVVDCNNVLLSGKKYEAKASPYIVNGVPYIPLRVAANALGRTISWDNEKGAAVDGVFFKSGETTVKGKNGAVDLKLPVTVKDGVMYAPAEGFGKALDVYTFVSFKGLVVYADYILALNDDIHTNVIIDILNYLVFDRPNAETIIKAFNQHLPKNNHPRLYATSDEFALMKEKTKTDSLMKQWSDNTVDLANRNINNPLAKYQFDSAGTRLQGGPNEKQILYFYWAWYITGDNKYFEAAKEQTLAMCVLPDWNPKHFLDTGARAGAVAVMYDLFYHQLDRETRDILAEALISKGIEPALAIYYGTGVGGFARNTNNWNVICNSGIVRAALALMGDYETEKCADTIEKSFKSLEIMMHQFAPEGAWFEGPSYWHYTIQYTVPLADAYLKSLGSTYGMMEVPGVKNTGYFPVLMSGNTGAFAYHDSPIYYRGNVMELFWFAKNNQDPDLARLRLNEMDKFNFKGNILDMLWFDENCVSDTVQLDLDKYYSYSEVASSRSGWDDNATFIGLHAGYNEVAHGQLDMGSFEYEVFGKRFASEVGRDDYNLTGYFDTNNGTRYSYYVNRAEGHNVYVINPSKDGGQIRYTGSDINVVAQKENGAIYNIDLTPAYANDVQSAKRGYMLSQNRNVFTVQDEILAKSTGEYYWFWHTPANITIEDKKTVVLENQGVYVKLHIEANMDYEVSSIPALPLPNSPVWDKQLGGMKSPMNKICIRFSGDPKTMVKLRVTAVPMGMIYNNAPLTDMSEWKIEDNQKTDTKVFADSILLDGTPIHDFNPENMSYTVKAKKTPVITASSEFDVEVTQATKKAPYASVIVRDKNDVNNAKVYLIFVDLSYNFDNVKPKGEKHSVVDIIASDIPEPANVPENVNDGKLETRWAADGTDHYIILDLGEVKPVSDIGLAIMNGQERIQYLDIQYSVNGEDFIDVAPATTNGTTANVEYAHFEPFNARYVKLICKGNSVNTWNSITEIEIYGN